MIISNFIAFIYSKSSDILLLKSASMVKGYKEEQVLDTPTDNCTIYQVSKEGKTYPY